MDERGGAGGGKSRFSVKNFCLTVPETSIGESFSVSLISAIEKVWIRGRGGVSRFSVEKFLFHRAEKLRTRTLQCFTSFGHLKIFFFRGLCHDFVSIFFV